MGKYKIKVNDEDFIVLQYVTGSQIKRLAGCDNEYYHTEFYCYEDRDRFHKVSDNEIVDLATPNRILKFITVFNLTK